MRGRAPAGEPARRARTKTRTSALAGALALAVSVGLAGCAKPAAVSASDIEQVTYAQYQALPGFDTTPRTTTDRADIEAFAAILDEYGKSGDVSDQGDQCSGSRSTTVDYAMTDGSAHHIEVGGCNPGDFGRAVDELVSRWRSR